MAFCESVDRRLAAAAERIDRASNLLRTRVEIEREAQNQLLLGAMNRRAKLQLRLQQTVEGLSVVAISYYAIAVLGYVFKGMETLGLNINLVYRLVFALGVALAAFAGMLAAPVSSVYPGMGTGVLIICFVVVVIGGIGSIWGALFAALLIGLADTFGKVLIPEAAGVTVYLLMAAILLWRPEGLFKRVG